MKYILIIGDGMADYPIKDLQGRTPLEVANHPNMDEIASRGKCGLLRTIPQGMEPGTDTAILSILGYDIEKHHYARGAIEALATGVELHEHDLALRCNLVTIENGVLVDHSAGGISTPEAKELINALADEFGKSSEIEFYQGVGHRHIAVLRGGKFTTEIKCVPPHNAIGKPISHLLVKPTSKNGIATAKLLNEIMVNSYYVLHRHPINIARVKSGEKPAEMICFWGPGKRTETLTPIERKYGISCAVISAINLVKGIGFLTGMHIVNVPGATGSYNTNYEGKADYALQSLRDHDMVLVHIEAPDEASHKGDYELKIKTIEEMDRRLVGRILDNIESISQDYVISVLADHVTSVATKKHATDPVPFAIYSSLAREENRVVHFNEHTVTKGICTFAQESFMTLLLQAR